MGIKLFGELFSANPVRSVRASSLYNFTDANLYWQKRRDTTCQNMTSSEFTRDFVDFLCDDLLRHELGRTSELYVQRIRDIQLIFDNKSARNFMKMWCCYQRVNNKKSTTSIPVDYDTIEYFLQEVKESLRIQRPGLDETALGKIRIIEAPVDTDDYIVSECMKLLLENPEFKEGRKISVQISDNTGDGDDDYCETPVLANLQTIRVSDVAIFSEDTDFISFFPFAEEVAVYSSKRVDSGGSCIYLLNAHLNETHPTIIEITKLARTLSSEYSRVSYNYIFGLVLKIYAMLSPNDYITCSFVNMQCLSQAVSSVFLWYSGPLGQIKSKVHPKQADLKRAIAYLNENGEVDMEEDMEDMKDMKNSEDKDKNENKTKNNEENDVEMSKDQVGGGVKRKLVDGRDNNDTGSSKHFKQEISTSDDDLHLVLAELPISCVYAYWTCYLDRLMDERGLQKHIALVNNMLRVFIVKFACSPPKLVSGGAEEITTCNNQISEIVKVEPGQAVAFSTFDFQAPTKTCLSSTQNGQVRLIETIEDLDSTLATRWLTFFDKDFCSNLEMNFKRLLNESLKETSVLTRENLVSAIHVWFRMRACNLQNKYVCGLYASDRKAFFDQEDNSVTCFFRTSSHLANYFYIFTTGLCRIWFFEEQRLLSENQDRMRKRRIAVSSQWFKMFCLATYDFFMPCDHGGAFKLNPHEVVGEGKVGAKAKPPKKSECSDMVSGKWSYTFEKFYENAVYHTHQYI